jgi:hypothetical protein
MRARLAAVIACAVLGVAVGNAAGATASAGPAAGARAPLTGATLAGIAAAAGAETAHSARSQSSSTVPGAPIPVARSSVPPAGRRLSSDQVLAIAGSLPKMKAVRARYPGSHGGAYLKPGLRWQVSFFSRDDKKEIGQVIIDDVSGRVLEQWTGFQVAWTMARGYPGAFGRHVNSLYVWLPMCVLFVLPFINWRRPLSLLHLDLLVLLSFSLSLAFFNRARIYQSVPLTYPPLLYLLARMLAICRARLRGRRGPQLRLLVPPSWLAVAVIFLLGFRVALNVVDSNVIDVGYAGVIGAQRVVQGKALYGHWPADNEHGDTYGPANYELYVPFEQVFGFSGHWDDLPAAHAAAIFFDLLATGLLFLLGRRVRGPALGIVLAYAWVSYPFTLYALENNANDTLVAVLVSAALLAASRPAARGALTALAGLTKFAPLALAPLFATSGLARQRGLRAADGRADGHDGAPRPTSLPQRQLRRLALFALGFVVAGALASIPALRHDTLQTIYNRTLVYQANRGSPFSVWGLYGGLHGLQVAVQVAAVVLALALAIVLRGRDLVALAAASAAVLIALQLGVDHWFYLYIPWFAPPALLALLGGLSARDDRQMAVASAPARSSRRAVAVST